jgi:hypothetical protein
LRNGGAAGLGGNAGFRNLEAPGKARRQAIGGHAAAVAALAIKLCRSGRNAVNNDVEWSALALLFRDQDCNSSMHPEPETPLQISS